MIDNTLVYSRPQATAQKLAASAVDAHRFTEKTVLLTGEAEILRSQNGRHCFLDSMRLLPRTVQHVHVYIPASHEGLREEAVALAREIEFGKPIHFLDSPPIVEHYDAILSVGTQVKQPLPWTTINSNGWIARVSSKAAALPADCDQANPIASLAAACLGVTDVFKRLIRLRPEVADVFDRLEFSLFDYKTEFPSLGPALPQSLPLPPTLLAGGGAIGNGIALLLIQTNASGDIWILDRQKYGPENLGTCALLGPAGVGVDKAKYLADQIDSYTRLQPHSLIGEIQDLKWCFGTEIPYPQMILSGFDNVPARHHLQGLWPDHAIDGGIGEFGVQVFSHTWGSHYQCLKCHFVEPSFADPSRIAADATGLSVGRAANPDSYVTEDDVDAAPKEKQPWLKERIGHKVCSVVSEATIQMLGGSDREGFSPSVPFVACMSAALVVARAVRVLTTPQYVESKFVFDMLQGPANGIKLAERAKHTCECSARTEIIGSWRAKR